MTNDKKAHQIAWKYTKHYDPNCCKQECVEMGAKEMAIWKDQQWKEKAQTAFCYVNNCIGQCHNTVRPCELRQKFDDIMNGKWPTVEKTKTK